MKRGLHFRFNIFNAFYLCMVHFISMAFLTIVKAIFQ
uniref:Uncharacterized protein n=1 Tax=Anguilla anguilla TaxID=7936 RepID=A0A0E9P7P1_ANGAN